MLMKKKRTKCEVCHKSIIADSKCAGVEYSENSSNETIYYFCSQDHASIWSKQTK